MPSPSRGLGPPALSVWPPLPPATFLARRARALPWPLNDASCRLFHRARHGLFQGVTALGLPPGGAVLVPAYHHGSEVEALIQAGFEVRFYDLDEDMTPREESLDAQLDGAVALYLIHFIGFPQNCPRWREWADERGLLLFEDAAQSWLAEVGGRPAGSFGDLSIFCLYKSFGVPDGGALAGRALGGAAPATVGRPDAGVAQTALRVGAWCASRSGALAAATEPRTRRRHARAERASGGPGEMERDMELGDPAQGPLRLSRWLLERVVDPDAPRRRRANYLALLERLPEAVLPAFRSLPEGAAPWVFPVVAKDKELAMRRLRDRRIDALNFWRIHHPALDPARFPYVAELRATLLGLPVHQELRPRDLDRIANDAGECLGAN